MSDFVNQQNARPGGYDKVIADIAGKNVCPFCPEHLAEFHKKPIEHRNFWIVTDNQYPYVPSKHHKLIIHTQHIDHISKIVPEAWAELYEIVQELTTSNAIVGGTLLMRFGETRFTGASVTHLHANLVQSDPDDPAYDPAIGVRTRVG
jgi:diadenosine tetraphosphate (Ap4A) HIT family hydrolase